MHLPPSNLCCQRKASPDERDTFESNRKMCACGRWDGGEGGVGGDEAFEEL